MNIGVRRRLSTLGAATGLSAVMVLGLAGTASAEPAAQPAAVPAAVAPAAFVLTDRDWGRRCHREFHRGSWYEGGWDRGHHHRDRHFRPGWWSCRYR